jgi:nucleoside-diphosphate-sugar epimerase
MKRLLIIGCGDVALRMVPHLAGRYRLYALTHSASREATLRRLGIVPIPGDLDVPESLGRLGGLAHEVVHAAPPPSSGAHDTRTAALIRALARRGRLPQRFVYLSTSGVYGNCRGEWVPETRPLHPETARAVRRADAEMRLRDWGRTAGVAVSILRVPGIYAADRLPIERLKAGTPALAHESDPYTNHIHADDLARIVVATLLRGRAGRAYNASDDSGMRMGEYFDLVAGHFGLPRPPRVAWQDAVAAMPAQLLSFMQESRRLVNDRLKNELRVRLRHATVADALAGVVP